MEVITQTTLILMLIAYIAGLITAMWCAHISHAS
jgi:uncharacterized membrane protein YqaE (UPF0057 family)